MKRFLLFALVATMFAACVTDATEDVAVGVETSETLTVSFEGDSRIQLQNGKTVWNEGDLVSVFYLSNANQKWQYQGETGERTGNLKRVSNAEATQELSNVVIVYPYNENYYINPRTCNVRATLPATQHYLKDSYGLDGNILISASEYNQFSLKNVCGWLKVQLKGEGQVVKTITVKGNNGEQVAGQIYINSTDATATLAAEMGTADEEENGTGGTLVFDDTIINEVSLDCGEGVTLGAEATAFYIALPPQTFKGGVTVTFINSDGASFEKSTDKTVIVERNTIQPMAAIDAEFPAPNDEIWYTSSDGNIVTPCNSYAFGAKILSNTYKNGKGVIKFDGDVTSIGSQAFLRCDLTRVTIPDGVTEIGRYAFSNCSLTSVTIPDSVTSIGADAFSECKSLASVTFGDSITLIGGFAFSDCNRLTNVTIPDSVTSIGNCAFVRCNMLTSVTIPNSITEFGYNVFADCRHLTSVTIIDGITLIGEGAFTNCSSLTSITIPDSVTEIGERAFGICTSLTSVTIPDSVTEIGNGAFSNCSSLQAFHGKFASEDNRCLIVDGVLNSFAPAGLTEYTISNSVTSIESSAFSGCSSLTSVIIPNSVTKIGNSVFSGCKSLTSITIPDSVTSIEWAAFANCTSLTSITVPDSVTSIGNSVFSGCKSLTSITIPDSVTSIENYAFDNCTSLTSITIPNSVTSIGAAAFQSCKSLTSITIPDSITEIGAYAFSGCTSLTSVYCKPTTPPIAAITSYYWDTFNKNASGRKIYVPRNSVNAYKYAMFWNSYASDIVGYDF